NVTAQDTHKMSQFRGPHTTTLSKNSSHNPPKNPCHTKSISLAFLSIETKSNAITMLFCPQVATPNIPKNPNLPSSRRSGRHADRLLSSLPSQPSSSASPFMVFSLSFSSLSSCRKECKDVY